jgi:hypothetical protein
MSYLPGTVVALWFGGLIFFAGRSLNDTRLILNNLAHDAKYWEAGAEKNFGVLGTRFRMQGTAIDPALLTDVGREHLKRAIRNQRVMFAWGLGGFILSASCFSYFKASGLTP